MKRCLLFAFLILSSVYFFASNPNWLDKYQRDLLYPRDNYFIGFVQTEIEYDYQYEETVKRLKEQARFELISSIRVTVQSVQTNVSQSDQIIGTQGFEEVTREQYTSASKIQSEVKDLPGLNIEDWFDAKTKTIYVFAWVNKLDWEKKLTKQIIVAQTRAEMEYENAAALDLSGEKVKAVQTMQKVISTLNEIESVQDLLLSVNSSIDVNDLGSVERNNLEKRAISYINDSNNRISICIIDSTFIFGNKYSHFESNIKNELSQIGCIFTEEQTSADWVITICGQTEEYNVYKTANFTSYIVLANVKLTMYKVSQGLCVFEKSFSEKGGHTQDFQRAAGEAYKYLSPQIASIIKKQIQL